MKKIYQHLSLLINPDQKKKIVDPLKYPGLILIKFDFVV